MEQAQPQHQADGGSLLSELLKKPISQRVEEAAAPVVDNWTRVLAEAQARKNVETLIKSKSNMQLAYERDKQMYRELNRQKMSESSWERQVSRRQTRCSQCKRIGCTVGPQEEV